MIYLSRPAFCLTAMFLSLLVFTSAFADAPLRKVTVIGAAIVKIAPDEMLWTVQIGINDATLAKAKDRHDASLNAALKYVKGLGDAVKDLQTGGIRFDKNLYPGDNAEARKNPFSCSTQFTFTLTDFDKYGPIADALSKLDGAQVQAVDYSSSKRDAATKNALQEALLNAHDKADGLATTAGCYINKPLEIVEGSPDNGPRPTSMMMVRVASGGPGTPPAVPGQLEISATLTVTYDLYYK
jgi:uncharacterized protein YggE